MDLKRHLLKGIAVFISALIVSTAALFILGPFLGPFIPGDGSGIFEAYFVLLCLIAIGLAAVFIFIGPSFFADWASIRKARQRYKRDS